MPLYTFRCKSCGHEEDHYLNDPTPSIESSHESCDDTTLRRVYLPTSMNLGWLEVKHDDVDKWMFNNANKD